MKTEKAKVCTFEVELLEPTIVSRSSATIGGHRTLSYLPGGVFLGIAAGRLYQSLGSDAFRVFHSGQLRFGWAYPVTETGRIALPAPLVWQVTKGWSVTEHFAATRGSPTPIVELDCAGDDRCPGSAQSTWRNIVMNPQASEERFEVQPELAVDVALVPAQIRTVSLVRTAIDRRFRDMPRDGQLFGYEALAKGQKFRFQMTADGSIGELFDRVKGVFDGTHHYVGRSKAADTGKVHVRIVPDTEYQMWKAIEHQSLHDGSLAFLKEFLTVLCVSDVAPCNSETGASTPRINPELFGFQSGEAVIDWSRSSLKFRRYSVFNNKRGHHDIDRQVICAGSVIGFKISDSLTLNRFREVLIALERGVGGHRAEGLGRVIAVPDCVHSFPKLYSVPHSPRSPHHIGPSVAVIDEPPTYFTLLQNRAGAVLLDSATTLVVQRWKADARRCAETLGRPIASKAQWGVIRAEATNAGSRETLHARLFGAGSGALRRGAAAQRFWLKSAFIEGKRQSVVDWLMGLFDLLNDDGWRRMAIAAQVSRLEDRLALASIRRFVVEYSAEESS